MEIYLDGKDDIYFSNVRIFETHLILLPSHQRRDVNEQILGVCEEK